MASTGIIHQTRDKFTAIISEHRLGSERIQVSVGPISAKDAIGTPERKDYPLLEGKEVMVEAQFRESFGHAFTDRPRIFEGTVKDLLDLNPDVSSDRAVFYSAVNAVAADLGIVTGTRHCRDDEPEKCAAQIADDLLQRFGNIPIGIIGFQPAIMDHLIRKFGANNIKCSDLNPNNIGSVKYGSRLLDGRKDTKELITSSDLILVTSSTIVNGTFDDISREALSHGKHIIIFGVTGSGVSALLNLERVCHYAH